MVRPRKLINDDAEKNENKKKKEHFYIEFNFSRYYHFLFYCYDKQLKILLLNPPMLILQYYYKASSRVYCAFLANDYLHLS